MSTNIIVSASARTTVDADRWTLQIGLSFPGRPSELELEAELGGFIDSLTDDALSVPSLVRAPVLSDPKFREEFGRTWTADVTLNVETADIEAAVRWLEENGVFDSDDVTVVEATLTPHASAVVAAAALGVARADAVMLAHSNAEAYAALLYSPVSGLSLTELKEDSSAVRQPAPRLVPGRRTGAGHLAFAEVILSVADVADVVAEADIAVTGTYFTNA
ncbi:hypothetical protein [Leifsonia sp. Leaf264]|uniref:hypothetical protein n=1 Tax=Leifsonia sp. Leaf264 TaxID=1736314 RepID=UPI0006FC953C|nr:hypothetical protein [Leifsonia sp. Leaf264]KQO98302.1 hypothetical protein ASF30_09590 [Leifsonia sp. Leaf264]